MDLARCDFDDTCEHYYMFEQLFWGINVFFQSGRWVDCALEHKKGGCGQGNLPAMAFLVVTESPSGNRFRNVGMVRFRGVWICKVNFILDSTKIWKYWLTLSKEAGARLDRHETSRKQTDISTAEDSNCSENNATVEYCQIAPMGLKFYTCFSMEKKGEMLWGANTFVCEFRKYRYTCIQV